MLVAALIGCFCASAQGAGRANVAALQVALRAVRTYGGTIDGVIGPQTRGAVARFQRRHRLAVDGIAGPRTLRALGRRGRPRLGRRLMHPGQVGFDVAALQFRLAWRGFPSGPFDGRFGLRTAAAVRRFQRWAHLAVDGLVGRATLHALRGRVRRSPLRFGWPLAVPIGDGFGPRGNRFHPGLDLPAAYGSLVRAARTGRVRFAGWNFGGYGKLVVLRHRRGMTSMYGHLSRILVRRGRRVRAGAVIGRVGSTGHSTGPHLHFELRLRGAAIDPRTGLR